VGRWGANVHVVGRRYRARSGSQSCHDEHPRAELEAELQG
jgi:hypothetical protein